MTKKRVKKLELNRETLRTLDHEGLREVHGAIQTERSVCNCPVLSIGNCLTRTDCSNAC